MKLYAEISKTEQAEDGTIRVYGYASSGAVDADGETITPEAMKAALPDYMKWGAVREMHQPLAAGTAIAAEVQDDGRTFFGAHVIDPVACKKVAAGVYKGFSIGGRVLERDPTNRRIIKALKLTEVSLVDRPANPEAVFTVVKMEAGEGEPAGQGVPASATPQAAEPLAKSLYGVAEFASALNGLSHLVADAQYEAQAEGDNSPIPAALRGWLADGLALMQAMAVEEAQQVSARLAAMVPAPAGQTLAQAEPAGELSKAGARFSAATQAALKAAHAACKAADKALADLGYDAEDEAADEPGSKKAELVQSAAQPSAEAASASTGVDDSQKAGASDDLSKALDAARADIAQAQKERDDALKKADEQAKRIAELEAKPEPPKGVLKAFGKAQDAGAGEATDAPVSPRDAIRKAHQTGGFRLA